MFRVFVRLTAAGWFCTKTKETIKKNQCYECQWHIEAWSMDFLIWKALQAHEKFHFYFVAFLRYYSFFILRVFVNPKTELNRFIKKKFIITFHSQWNFRICFFFCFEELATCKWRNIILHSSEVISQSRLLAHCPLLVDCTWTIKMDQMNANTKKKKQRRKQQLTGSQLRTPPTYRLTDRFFSSHSFIFILFFFFFIEMLEWNKSSGKRML